MATDSHTGGIGALIVRARKSHWGRRIQTFIPKPLRRLAWQAAVSRSHYTVLGSRMFIPHDARSKSLLLDEYEPAVTQCMQRILREGMTFCDVGANIGVFTLFAAKLVGPGGRVVAFEPVPENATVLRTNVALNDCGNILILEKAIAEKRGRAEIHLSSLCGCHSLVGQPDAAIGRTLCIETVRLDDISELAEIDLLKIDAEGAEVAVLRSLGSRRPRHLILEFNAPRTRAAGYTGAQFLQVLNDLGYTRIENLDQPVHGTEVIAQDRCDSTNLYARFSGRPQ